MKKYKQHYINPEDETFGTIGRKRALEELMKKGLVKRITLIEGNYPTKQEQKNFLNRIIRWLNNE